MLIVKQYCYIKYYYNFTARLLLPHILWTYIYLYSIFQAREHSYRARSAFKLIEINNRYKFINRGVISSTIN